MTPLTSDWDRGSPFPSQTARQSRYGIAYLAAVCAQFGTSFKENNPDEDFFAMDATIGFPAAEIRVQVKCTTRTFNQSQNLRIDVEESWIEKWKRNINPAFLVVVQVDPEAGSWIDYDVDYETLHKASAYWIRVDDIAHSQPKSVQVPFTNRFTAETVRDWQDLLLGDYGA